VPKTVYQNYLPKMISISPPIEEAVMPSRPLSATHNYSTSIDRKATHCGSRLGNFSAL